MQTKSIIAMVALLLIMSLVSCDSEPPTAANGRASMAPGEIEGYNMPDDLRDVLDDLEYCPDVLLFLEATQDDEGEERRTRRDLRHRCLGHWCGCRRRGRAEPRQPFDARSSGEVRFR